MLVLHVTVRVNPEYLSQFLEVARDHAEHAIADQQVYYSDPDLAAPPIRGRPAQNVDQGRIDAPGAR